LDRVDRPRGRVAPSGAAAGTPAVRPLSEDPLEHFRSGRENEEKKATLFFLPGVVVSTGSRARKARREISTKRMPVRKGRFEESFRTEEKVSLSFR
jgi:hypothetical protein